MIGANPSKAIRERDQAKAREIRTISIYVTRDGYFSIFEKDLVAEALAWDEMLGQIALMTLGPKLASLIGRGPYSGTVDRVLYRMERHARALTNPPF